MLFTVDSYFCPSILTEENDIAGLNIELTDGSVFQNFAASDSDDFSFYGFFFCSIRNDNAAFCFFPLPELVSLERDPVRGESSC